MAKWDEDTAEYGKRTGNRKLNTVIGAGAAAILIGVGSQVGFTERFEGMFLYGYYDPIGIPTKCAGDIYNVEIGKRYTKEECRVSLEQGLIKHAEPVLKCAPYLKDNPFFLAAAIDHNYNFGKFCGTTVDREFKAGNYVQACNRFNSNADGSLAWSFVKDKKIVAADGKVTYTYKTLPGLIKRAGARKELCIKGLDQANVIKQNSIGEVTK